MSCSARRCWRVTLEAAAGRENSLQKALSVKSDAGADERGGYLRWRRRPHSSKLELVKPKRGALNSTMSAQADRDALRRGRSTAAVSRPDGAIMVLPSLR